MSLIGRVVLFTSVSPCSLPLALACRLFARVQSLELRGRLNTPGGLALIEGLGLELLRVEQGDLGVIEAPLHMGDAEVGRILQHLGWLPENVSNMGGDFPGVSDLGRKLTLAMRSGLGSWVYPLCLLHFWACWRARQGMAVAVYVPSPFWADLCAARGRVFPNLCIFPFRVAGALVKGAGLFIRTATRLACRVGRTVSVWAGQTRWANRSTLPSAGTRLSEAGLGDRSPAVALFPHEGVEYGKLFLKDHYYCQDPANPYHMTAILHVEMEHVLGLSQTTRERIEAFYQTRAIPFQYLRKRWTADDLLALPGFVRRVWKGLSPRASRAGRLQCVGQACVVWLLFRAYLRFLAGIPSLKVALVGYDWLFPIPLSLALQSAGVHVAAVQERYGQMKFQAFRFVADTYFVTSPYWVEEAGRAGNVVVDHAVAVGEYRTDVLHEYLARDLPEEFQTLKNHGKIVVLALDFHSVGSVIEDAKAHFNHWSSNRQFYRHVLRLAVERPNVHLVIRGKNARWLTLPAFEDLAAVAKALPNVWVNTDYSRHNVSYELAAWADIVIGRYSSMLDEILFAGKPALVLDYLQNGQDGSWRRLDDRAGLPVFVSGYDDLLARLDALMAGTDPLLGEECRRLREMVYGKLFDGRAKPRLRAELERIMGLAGQTSSPVIR